MKEIKTIVVPIDLNSHTKKLVGFSIYFAKQLNAAIRFIHIVEDAGTGSMMVGSPSFEPIYKEQVTKAEIMVSNIVKNNEAAIADIDGVVIRGDIVEEVVEYAAAKDAGLLIIGTHGARGLEKILLGSVAERLIKRVHCPTLTMNPHK